MTDAKKDFLLPVAFVVLIFGAMFSLYFYLREVTEENIRATLLEQYEQRQVDATIIFSRSIAADLDLLMTKLQVLAQSGPVQAGDFASEETDLLMKRIYDESNTIARVEGIGISNAQNIVMNVYQPEIDKNQLIGQNMASRPFAVEARNNLPNPTFSSGYETVVNDQGQRMALLYPIYDSQGAHMGWTRTAIDASLFFERYGNIIDAQSEYFTVLDRNGNILVNPQTNLEGRNIADEDVQGQLAYAGRMDEYLRQALSGQARVEIFSEPIADTINTAYPIIVRDQPTYFVFLVTPTSLIYSEIDSTLFAQQVQTIALFAVSAAVISALVFFMTRRNLVLRKAVSESTAELASSSARLESLNDELKTRNELLLKSNRQLAEKETELKEVIAKARNIERSKQEFSSMITHELKTPLVPIIGYGSLLLNEKLGELTPRQKEKLQIMFNSAKKLAALSQDLLDVQKLELGELHLSMVDTSASQIIEGSISSLATEAEVRNIILINNSNGGAVLRCDPDRIAQVLNNLVNNAIKFSHEGGKIDLDAKLEDASVIFSVKDHGIGIPKNKQDRIFTKFYQVDTSLTRKAGGTGLGLAVCRGIVEAHGGKIWLESEEGKGSIFSFSIPVGGAIDKENTGR